LIWRRSHRHRPGELKRSTSSVIRVVSVWLWLLRWRRQASEQAWQQDFCWAFFGMKGFEQITHSRGGRCHGGISPLRL